jgi:hypothetical protein
MIKLTTEETINYRDYQQFVKDQGKENKELYFEDNALASWVQIEALTACEIAWLLSEPDVKFDNITAVKSVLAWFEQPDEKQQFKIKRSARASEIMKQLVKFPELYKETLKLLVIGPAEKMHLVQFSYTENIDDLIAKENGENDD